jgi:group I intron endonuclease
MFYLIYKITNIINNKIYIGSHKTKDINDGYMGSGKYLNRAFSKYGKENFTKEILFEFDNAKDMYAKETEIVNEDFLKRNDIYNLKVGGQGGFDYINSKKLNNSTGQYLKAATNSANKRLGKPGRKHTEEEKIQASKRVSGDNRPKLFTFKGRKHSLKTKQKMKENKKHFNGNRSIGVNNSQFGTMWITNGTENRKIKKDAIVPDGWYKGRYIKAILEDKS